MEAILGLFVILAGVAYGTLTSCDDTQNRTLCYGALGGTFYYQIPTNAEKYDELRITKNLYLNGLVVVKMKNRSVKVNEYFNKRATFFEGNGTFLIAPTERNDSDGYAINTFSHNGTCLFNRQLHLFIEAPVSTPDLTTVCLTDGEMRVSCSSKGDSVQFNWTLVGDPLLDTESTVGNETNIITLKKGWSGNLTCHVRNHISNAKHSIQISKCPGPASQRCLCRRVRDKIMGGIKSMDDIQIFPPSPSCTRLEIVVHHKNGVRYCLDPKMQIVKRLITRLMNKSALPTVSSPAEAIPTESYTDSSEN